MADKWNYIIADAQTRWIRLKAGCPLFSESSLYYDLKAATALDMAGARLVELEAKGSPRKGHFGNRYLALKTAYEILADTSTTVSTASDLSIESMFKTSEVTGPVISDIFPHVFWRNDATQFVLVGTNLNPCAAVTLAGIPCTGLNLDDIVIPGKKAGAPPKKYQVITATFPGMNPFRYLTNTTVSVDCSAIVTGQGRATKTVTLTLQGNILSPDAVVTVSRDTNSSKITGIQIKDGEKVAKDKLLDGIKGILEKSEPAPKIIITSP